LKNKDGRKLNENARSGKTFTEFPWRTAFFLFEYPVEIRDIIEPAMIGDFGNRVRGINQDAARMTQSDLRQAINKCIARPLSEKSAERNITHVGQFRNL